MTSANEEEHFQNYLEGPEGVIFGPLNNIQYLLMVIRYKRNFLSIPTKLMSGNSKKYMPIL